MSPSKKILIGLTGSIACYKTCMVISRLKQAGYECRIIATSQALKFIGEATLEGLSGEKIYSDTFTSGEMMSHIELARWADVFLVAPMTAHHINKFYLGLADDLLTTTYLAYEKNKPLFIAPAMNSVMLAHATVQESLEKLRSRGVIVLDSHAGTLACGEEGYGKMMEPEQILEKILAAAVLEKTWDLNTAPHKPKEMNLTGKSIKFLVTLGGTREPIDGVRSINNVSTGATGSQLVDNLRALGHDVVALAARDGRKPKNMHQVFEFESHSDLENLVLTTVAKQHFDVVIQLAAVSDFSVDRITTDGVSYSPSHNLKISSDQPVTLDLKLNSKIVNKIKNHSLNKNIQVIAFKLTNSIDESEHLRAVQKLLDSKSIDRVVHNDLNQIDKLNHKHPFYLYDRSGHREHLEGVAQLANKISQFSQENINHGPMS